MPSSAPLFAPAAADPSERLPTLPAHRSTEHENAIERDLWKAANALRGSVDAAEFKHILLGIVFLKYASGVGPAGGFRIPERARWQRILAVREGGQIGLRLDDAMAAIEEANPELREALPGPYVRPGLSPQLLGQAVSLVHRFSGVEPSVASETRHPRDLMGRVYEYLLSQFASAEGRKGGEFYTPGCVVSLLVQMLQPWRGRVYDPCCGSGGMFVQSVEFVRAHRQNGRGHDEISIYGQESNHTTWKLARMNMAIRGIHAEIAFGDTFHEPAHPSLRADFVLANPPFNISAWNGHRLRRDPRWKFGTPPATNANFAWVQHIVHHLAPGGSAGIVLANGSLNSRQNGEEEIRRRLIEADLLDCVVALPGQLFYSTPIPACVWILSGGKTEGSRPRPGETLFLDARTLGSLTDRTHRSLGPAEVSRIADAYRAWRGDRSGSSAEEPGFSRPATLEEIRRAGFDVNPGRYVSAPTGVARWPSEDLTSTVGRLGAMAEGMESTLRNFAGVAPELPGGLRDTVERIAASGKPGCIGDLVTANRRLVDPRRRPADWFELYSIPALDATGLPERRRGREILSGKLKITAPALLVSRLNPRRMRVWPVERATERAVCSTEFAVLVPKREHLFEFLFLVLSSRPFQQHLVARATGSTGSRQRVRLADVLEAPVLVPRDEELTRLEELLRPVREWMRVVPLQRQAVRDVHERICDLLPATALFEGGVASRSGDQP